MDHKVSDCKRVAEYYYDEYSNRLFTACTEPGTVYVWDISNNFNLIKSLVSIVSVYLVSAIAFYPEEGLLMIIGVNYDNTIYLFLIFYYFYSMLGGHMP